MATKGYITFYDGIQACVPTILGYVGIGISMGIVGKSVGLSIAEIALMSILVYAGSAQFIICAMVAIQAPIPAILLTTFLVNLRHFLMSMSVSPYFKTEPLKTGIGIGTLLTDESYGVLMTALNNKYLVTAEWTNGLNITAYVSWIGATIIGGLLGNWIPDPYLLGLDFALVAMFVGLLVLQVDLPFKKQPKKTGILLIVVCISLYVSMRVFSAEISVLLATILGCVLGVIIPDE